MPEAHPTADPGRRRERRVIASMERQTIPTYVVGQPDPTPPIGRPWGYWRIYPYPMLDDLTNRREDVEYDVIVLENEYLRLSVLPDLGGHLYAYDKVAERDIFYRPAVIKPALIALRGAWIAGGIEFNFPVSHNPLTFAPVDRRFRQNEDGSATVFIGAYEQLSRMRWTVGITLQPNSARIDTDIRVENRTHVPNRFYFWSNSAERVSEGTRFISPVSSVHGWQGTMRYPVHNGEYVPAYRNHHVACDLFSRNVQADFFGCYDDNAAEGIVNVASRHEVTGRKYFTWGNSDDGLIWNGILSDNAGPYIEIQSGPFETQSIFKLLQPHQAMRWSESWFEIRDTGGFEFANETVALNITRDDDGAVLHVHGTEAAIDVTVTADIDGASLGTWDIDLDPAEPVQINLGADVSEGCVHVLVTARSYGVIADAMLPWRCPTEDDIESQPLLAEDEQDTVHGLYARGLDAEQQNNLPQARDYYERALEKDPLALLALSRLGILDLKTGRLASAVERLEHAARIVPDSGEVNYYLGLALRAVGREQDATRVFWRTRLDPHFGAMGRYQLGEMSAVADDLPEALSHFREAADHAAIGTRAWNAQMILLRAMRRFGEAEALLHRVEAIDPLNLTVAVERAWIAELTGDDGEPAWAAARELVRDEPQIWIELAVEYAALGLRQSALRLIDEALSFRPRALLQYHRAYFLDRFGQPDQAAEARNLAKTTPVGDLYAHRVEEEPVLRTAMDADPADSVAPYLLGTMLFMFGRTEEGRELWKIAEDRGSLDASLFSVMGWAAWNIDRNTNDALTLYQRAVDRRPHDHRLYAAMDTIREAAGQSPAERMTALRGLADPVRRGGRLPQRFVQLHTLLGNWKEGESLLQTERFHPWEGERTMRPVYTDFHVALGEHLMDAGKHEAALAAFEQALEYPRNVGVGKPYRPTDAPFYYRAGIAAEYTGEPDLATRYWREGAAETHHAVGTPAGVYRDLCRIKLGEDEALASMKSHRNALAEKDSPTADLLAALGVAELALGNTEAARESFQAARAKSPYHLLATRELARLE